MLKTYKNFNPKVEKFSEYLMNYSGELWLDATNHKFTNELKNDTLKNHIFKKYTKKELEKFYPTNNKNVIKSTKPVCSKCRNPIFKDKLCKKHFKNRFFDN